MEHNLGVVHEAIAGAVGERDCIVTPTRRLSWTEVTDRSRRLAHVLHGAGLGAHRERSDLHGWESGQDQLGIYLHNCPEYLETMLGSFKARVAQFNVNYRYVREELVYLLRDAHASGLVYHATFAPQVAAIRDELPDLRVLIQVEDGSGEALLDGAIGYEEALAAAPAGPPPVEPSPDDLYILYTGGTTGMPKGVLWRQADAFIAAMGGADADLSTIADGATGEPSRTLPAPPFMHGAAHWIAFNVFTRGGTIVLPSEPRRLDPHDIWSTVEREKVDLLLIVGDAFGRPLADQLRERDYDLSSLRLITTGGAPLNAAIKQELVAAIPHVLIADVVGSSETGSQGSHVSTAGGVATGSFTPGPNTRVLSEDLTRLLEPGTDEIGWLAQTGRIPLGYLGDEQKTRRTFPDLDGVRYSVPGDRATLNADGSIGLLGRDSVTINSGGEKIFAEEVEAALRNHADVFDVVVTGRPSERWGQEVVAVVQLRDGASCTADDLLVEAAKHVARYKLPKAVVLRDHIVRSPAGKADYRWAKAQVTD